MPDLPPDDAERLDNFHFQFGPDAGNLALTLDYLTDILRALNQHTISCRVEKGPRAGEAPLDVVELTRLIHACKKLVQESHLRLATANPIAGEVNDDGNGPRLGGAQGG